MEIIHNVLKDLLWLRPNVIYQDRQNNSCRWISLLPRCINSPEANYIIKTITGRIQYSPRDNSFKKAVEMPWRQHWISPLSRLKLVMSVEVSSSSLDRPSLCSALFPFCSLACRRRVLFQINITEHAHVISPLKQYCICTFTFIINKYSGCIILGSKKLCFYTYRLVTV